MTSKEELNALFVNAKMVCEICDRPAKMNCSDCSIFICGDCFLEHKRNPLTKDHHVVSIANMEDKHVRGGKTEKTHEPCSAMDPCVMLRSNAADISYKVDESKQIYTTESMAARDVQAKQRPFASERYAAREDAFNKPQNKEPEKTDNGKQHGKGNKNQVLYGEGIIVSSSCRNLEVIRTCECITAAHLCKDCKEFFCQNRFAYHKSQNITKTHSMLSEDIIPLGYCKLCKEDGRKMGATNGCMAFVKCLCDSCSKMHPPQQATNQYQLKAVSLPDFHDCSPCTEGGKVNTAYQYCQICTEYLCDNCSKMHSRQKATENHILKSANKAREGDGVRRDDSIKSEHKELLTTAQDKQRKKEKQKQDELRPGKPFATKILSDSLVLRWEIPKKLESSTPTYQLRYKEKGNTYWTFRAEQPHTAQLVISGLMSKCTYIFQVRAIGDEFEGPYSSESEEVTTKPSIPPKCSTKPNIGEKTNMFARGVQAKFDLGKLYPDKMFSLPEPEAQGDGSHGDYFNTPQNKESQNRAKNKQQGKENLKEVLHGGDIVVSSTCSDLKVIRICESCDENGDIITATHLCKTCKEFLCQTCSAYHKRQKITKTHTLFSVDIIQFRLCKLCKEDGRKMEANNECMTCVEFLCDACSKTHQLQNATKHHRLKAVSLRDVHDCSPCTEEGNVNIANQYCPQCREFLCDNCSRMHVQRKGKRNHVLQSAYDGEREDEVNKPQNKELQRTAKDKQYEKEKQKLDERRPGKPFAKEILSDSLVIEWEVPTKHKSDILTYQIRYQEEGNKQWIFYLEQPHKSCVVICGLKSECTYVFQVRAIGGDIEGPYSSESEEVTTKSSLASRLLPISTKIKGGKPSIYKLNTKENMAARDVQAKTRKLILGIPPILNVKEKTILLVGSSGSGKSTLVNGIINYVTGVNWKDPFRFTLVDLESGEKNKNEAHSQTEWITCYSVNPGEGSRLNYRLNIIDTPGFGDTRGLERDNEIVHQLRKLFSSKGERCVLDIDAVCLLVKAPDARLTTEQKYIFAAILSLFGKDIEENICALITFADGDNPAVLAAIKEADIPVKFWYPFNNSGLFVENDCDENSSLAPMYWKIGYSSFKSFFDSLQKMPKKSLQQTKEVLFERERLETTICQLQPQVDAGLNKVHELKREIQILTENEKKIFDTKDFEYEVEETQMEMEILPVGEHVTNCLICNRTCHYPCAIKQDEEKMRCAAMNASGNCTVCPGHCIWNEHFNNHRKFTFVVKKVKKTYSEKLKMYQEAGHEKLTHEQMVAKMQEELGDLAQEIEKLMVIVNTSINTLKEISLRPNPLSMVAHIDLMIESEKMEMKYGFKDRIKVLQTYKKRAEIHKDVNKLKQAFASESKNYIKGFLANLFNSN